MNSRLCYDRADRYFRRIFRYARYVQPNVPLLTLNSITAEFVKEWVTSVPNNAWFEVGGEAALVSVVGVVRDVELRPVSEEMEEVLRFVGIWLEPVDDVKAETARRALASASGRQGEP